MSVTTHSECAACGDSFDEFATPGYCSQECYNRKRGEDFLRSLEHNHCYCLCCATQIKTTAAPSEEWEPAHPGTSTDSIIGFEYHTKDADHGLKGKEIDAAFHDLVMTGVICGECGTCDHRDDFLRTDNIRAFVKNFVAYVDHSRAQGQHDKTVDIHDLIAELRATGFDVELSVGRVLESV